MDLADLVHSGNAVSEAPIAAGSAQGYGLAIQENLMIKWISIVATAAGTLLLSAGCAAVDLATATYSNSIGVTRLIGSFEDPSFDPRQRAFYYVRVLEVPTPRWTDYDAAKYKIKMTPDLRMKQQERAVTSPIWYTPTT